MRVFIQSISLYVHWYTATLLAAEETLIRARRRQRIWIDTLRMHASWNEIFPGQSLLYRPRIPDPNALFHLGRSTLLQNLFLLPIIKASLTPRRWTRQTLHQTLCQQLASGDDTCVCVLLLRRLYCLFRVQMSEWTCL